MSSMLFILGEKLAGVTAKEELVCRGMLRLAIEEKAAHLQQTREHQVWKEYLDSMDFQDWEAVLGAASLSQRLAQMGVADSATVVAQLRETLVEKQSVLTMAAR